MDEVTTYPDALRWLDSFAGNTIQQNRCMQMEKSVRDIRFLLRPRYGQSHALIIGINRYRHAGPLGYAVNDANAVYDRLTRDYGFQTENVQLLLDEDATSEAIRRAFLRFADQDSVGIDDRVVLFFAGHGATRRGVRGEIGYLVPHDGDLNDLSTLLRWDELTRNAEIIAAKHILFVMDACYGGLAVTRAVGAGSVRFINDMLKRISRQVLTAGKADETVADAGGPLPGHSVFTGHFLQGLDGAAATAGGVLTASGLMAYVYGRVSADAGSFQTPHYGHIDGDGDFIFRMPHVADADGTSSEDALFVVPYPEELDTRSGLESKVSRAKHLLAQPDRAIELHDFVIDELKRFLSATAQDSFNHDVSYSDEELTQRLAAYEECTLDLSVIEACLAYWAGDAHRPVLRKVLARSVDRLEASGGMAVWSNLRWYPLVLQSYCAGIAAVAAGRYDTLADVFSTEIHTAEESRPAFRAVADAILAFSRTELFKRLPGYERHHTPMSDYLFKLLQPRLDDALFIGRAYEHAFDEFEVLLALASAQAYVKEERSVWGPVGRFGWKHSRSSKAPLEAAFVRARDEGEQWAPFKAGLFGDNYGGFLKAAEEYRLAITRLNWF
ncbi:caspase family protein [Stenotrophomonas chelatiphaga]|uniref:caspase family protein n=1 Tax=Stenotrophomonas chelatiphaga TaxID=517011 RepID=UPI0028971939|nr:caspase family protein [Stenotrophomonas chelatiphaga]